MKFCVEVTVFEMPLLRSAQIQSDLLRSDLFRSDLFRSDVFVAKCLIPLASSTNSLLVHIVYTVYTMCITHILDLRRKTEKW